MDNTSPKGRLSIRKLTLAGVMVAIIAVIVALVDLYYSTIDLDRQQRFEEKSLAVELWLDPEDGSPKRFVTETEVFPTGALVRADVRTDTQGFLYVLTRSCDGLTELIFPNASESPWIEAGMKMELPQEGMRFKGNKGVDILLVVLSQRPLQPLERLVRQNHPPNGIVIDHPPDPELQKILTGDYPDPSMLVRRMELNHVDSDVVAYHQTSATVSSQDKS